MPEQPRSERKTQNRLIGLFTEAGARTSVKTSVKTSEKMSVKTSVKILQAILENAEITIPVLADRVGITTRSVERNIRKLQEEKRLRRIGPDTNQFIRKWTSPKRRWLLGARALPGLLSIQANVRIFMN
jgi:DNA-binding Lrp family transcriptional regulator